MEKGKDRRHRRNPGAIPVQSDEKGLRKTPQPLDFIGGPPGSRTPHQLIKSQLLYQLS